MRAISSSSKSVTVEPSSTSPSRLTAPAASSAAETSCVLPHPPWPTTATLRIAAASYTFIAVSLLAPRRRSEANPRRERQIGPPDEVRPGTRREVRIIGLGPTRGASGRLPAGPGAAATSGSNVNNYVWCRGSFDESVETRDPARGHRRRTVRNAIGAAAVTPRRNATPCVAPTAVARSLLDESDEDVLIQSPGYIVVVSFAARQITSVRRFS